MKLFGRKGKSIRIEILLAIVIILLVLCMGFGYCLRFTYLETYGDYADQIRALETRNDDLKKQNNALEGQKGIHTAAVEDLEKEREGYRYNPNPFSYLFKKKSHEKKKEKNYEKQAIHQEIIKKNNEQIKKLKNP